MPESHVTLGKTDTCTNLPGWVRHAAAEPCEQCPFLEASVSPERVLDVWLWPLSKFGVVNKLPFDLVVDNTNDPL